MSDRRYAASASHLLPGAYPDDTPSERPGPSLAQMLAILKAHRRIAVIVALATLGLGLIGTAVVPRSYSAVATMMVDFDVSNPLNGAELPIDQVSAFLATQIELIQRPELLAKVAAGLAPEDQVAFRKGYEARYGPVDQWVSTQIAKKLEVLPGQSGSHLIYVEFTASNARRAAAVANAVVDAYQSEERHRQAGLPQVLATNNGARLKELAQRVSDARQKVEQFESAHGLHGQTGNAAVESTVLQDLQTRLLDARTRRIAIESRALSSASAADEQGAVARMGDEARVELAAKERKLAEMTRSYGDQYPAVQAARQEVEDLRRHVSELAATGARNANLSAAQARQLEDQLQAQVDAQKGRLNAIGKDEESASRYWIELESAAKAYREALAGTYQAESALRRPGDTNVHVANRASVPLTARSPKTWLLMILAVLGALVAGLATPFLLELPGRKLRHADDLERGMGLPVLATLERVESGSTLPRLK